MTISRSRIRVAIGTALFALAGCGAQTQEKVGGETNWLSACDRDDDCDVGSCSCGVCTRGCEDESACDDIRGSVCSSRDPMAHVNACGSDEGPPICVARSEVRMDTDGGVGGAESGAGVGGGGVAGIGGEPNDMGGASGNAGSSSDPVDGASWNDILGFEAFAEETFHRIWGSSNDLWLLGSPRTTPGSAGMGPLALECPQDWSATNIVRRQTTDGWYVVEVPTTLALTDVHGSGPDDAWMVGLDGVVLHFDGESWTNHDVRLAEGLEFDEATEPCAELSLSSVFARTPTDVWVTGYVFPSTLGPGLILHFDGERWERSALDAPDSIFDVWASSASDAWAVGSSGLVYRFDGADWTAVPSNTTRYLRSVFGTAEDDVWIGGDSGTLLHFDGTTLEARSDLRGTSLVGNFSGSPAAGTFVFTTTQEGGQTRTQALWMLEDGAWTPISRNASDESWITSIVATVEGNVWGAGHEIVFFR